MLGSGGLYPGLASVPCCCPPAAPSAAAPAGLPGLYAGEVGLYAGDVGLYAGDVGLYCGEVGLYCGDVGLYCGEVGLYVGDVGLQHTRQESQVKTSSIQAGVLKPYVETVQDSTDDVMVCLSSLN
jgi:hypothetical protein